MEVGFAEPSNFTRYCCQYLGEDCFDTLEESEDEESEDGTAASLDSDRGQVSWTAEQNEGSAGEYEETEEEEDNEEEEEEEEESQVVIAEDTDEYGPGALSWL